MALRCGGVGQIITILSPCFALCDAVAVARPRSHTIEPILTRGSETTIPSRLYFINLMTASHRRIGWLTIALLLLLRIPYSVILTYASANNTGWGPAGFQLITYLLTVFLIWWERDDLSSVHIDTPAIVLIVAFGPAQTLILRYWGIDTPLTFPHPAGLLIWTASFALIIALWRSPQKPEPIKRVSLAWLAGGLLAGVLFSALPDIDAFLHVKDLSPVPSIAASTVVASVSSSKPVAPQYSRAQRALTLSLQ